MWALSPFFGGKLGTAEKRFDEKGGIKQSAPRPGLFGGSIDAWGGGERSRHRWSVRFACFCKVFFLQGPSGHICQRIDGGKHKMD